MIALRMCLWMTLLTGVFYPLIITGISQLTMNSQANGSFIYQNDKIVGAELIGQKFTSDKYFWGRPSANDYNGLASGGSNLAPTSLALKKAVEERRDALKKAHNIEDPAKIPAELLFASASGLDPHISLAAALFQVDRIVKSRGISKDKVEALINDHTEFPLFRIIGSKRVNVLKINLALDQHE